MIRRHTEQITDDSESDQAERSDQWASTMNFPADSVSEAGVVDP